MKKVVFKEKSMNNRNTIHKRSPVDTLTRIHFVQMS